MLHKILALLLLPAGIVAAIIITPLFLLLVGFPVAIYAITTGRKQRYALSVWLGFDKFMNACMGGDHLETISSRLGKSIDYNSPSVFFIKSIDWVLYKLLGAVDENHCTKSIDWKVGRKR